MLQDLVGYKASPEDLDGAAGLGEGEYWDRRVSSVESAGKWNGMSGERLV